MDLVFLGTAEVGVPTLEGLWREHRVVRSIPKNLVRRVEATKNRLRRFILGSISRHSGQNPLNTLL